MATQHNQKVKAKQHDSYITFTLIAILLPLVGVILGTIYLAKDSKLDKKLGEHILAIGVLFSFIAWPLAIYLLLSNPSNSSTDLTTTTTYSPSYSTPQVSSWDYQAAYDKISVGMTKAQVESVTVKPGTDCSESEVSGYTAEACTYGDSNDPGIIVVQYDNDLVTSKAKQAL